MTDPWSIELPIRLASSGNTRDGYMARHRKTKRLRGTAMAATVGMPSLRDLTAPGQQLVFMLTRIAPRALDSHENLPFAFKAVVDGLAARLGVPDNDPRLRWCYGAERGAVRYYAIRIDVSVQPDAAEATP